MKQKEIEKFVKDYNYEEVKRQFGFETLELTIYSDHPKEVAKEIFKYMINKRGS
jgi:hypothetical protein